MKVFFLSNHGFGHMIRSIPFLEQLSRNDRVYVASGQEQITFLKSYFCKGIERFSFHVVKTDIGFVNYDNQLKVNRRKTQKAICQYMIELPQLINDEVKKLKQETFTEIYADISPLGILVAKQMNKKVFVLTNFTWYKQYEHLNFDQKIIQFYYELDQLINELWLYPLAFPFHYIHCIKRKIEFYPRPIDPLKVAQMKAKYPLIVSIFSGMSSSMIVEIENYKGLIITNNKLQVKYNGPLIVLGQECLDTQNYIACSDLVITKAGFTTIAECISAKVNMLLVERPSAYEDTFLIQEVKKLGFGNSIKEKELKKLNLSNYLNT